MTNDPDEETLVSGAASVPREIYHRMTKPLAEMFLAVRKDDDFTPVFIMLENVVVAVIKLVSKQGHELKVLDALIERVRIKLSATANINVRPKSRPQ